MGEGEGVWGMEVGYVVRKKLRERGLWGGPSKGFASSHHTPSSTANTLPLTLSHRHTHTLTRMMRKPVEKLWRRNWKTTN